MKLRWLWVAACLASALGFCGCTQGLGDLPYAPRNFLYSTDLSAMTIGNYVRSVPQLLSNEVVHYSMVPDATNLPVGLSFNTGTGIISGTPTVNFTTTTFVVTVTNSIGSASVSLNIGVIAASAVVPPDVLSYAGNPYTFVGGNTIQPQAPVFTNATTNLPGTSGSLPGTYTGSVPAGLSLNPNTGIISGAPTAAASAASYPITFTNTGGSSVMTTLSITVSQAPPSALVYNYQTTSYPQGFTINPIVVSSINLGGAPNVSYSIFPSLAATGLQIAATTGIISGTTVEVGILPASYTVTATTTLADGTTVVGSTSTTLTIGVLPTTPSGYSYNPSTLGPFTVGTAITNIPPANTFVSGYSGNAFAGVVFTVNPSLPSGLTLDPNSGIISGTPTAPTAAANYSFLLSNPTGSAALNVVNKFLVNASLLNLAEIPASGKLAIFPEILNLRFNQPLDPRSIRAENFLAHDGCGSVRVNSANFDSTRPETLSLDLPSQSICGEDAPLSVDIFPARLRSRDGRAGKEDSSTTLIFHRPTETATSEVAVSARLSPSPGSYLRLPHTVNLGFDRPLKNFSPTADFQIIGHCDASRVSARSTRIGRKTLRFTIDPLRCEAGSGFRLTLPEADSDLTAEFRQK